MFPVSQAFRSLLIEAGIDEDRCPLGMSVENISSRYHHHFQGRRARELVALSQLTGCYSGRH